jgi:hypothetical protein
METVVVSARRDTQVTEKVEIVKHLVTPKRTGGGRGDPCQKRRSPIGAVSPSLRDSSSPHNSCRSKRVRKQHSEVEPGFPKQGYQAHESQGALVSTPMVILESVVHNLTSLVETDDTGTRQHCDPRIRVTRSQAT